MEEKYLPVGTVVRLQDGTKSIMITGFCAISGEDGKMYDYSACLYPEGIVGPEFNLLFNHNKIAEILYKGFVSSEETEFKQKLNVIIAEKIANGELPSNDGTINNPTNIQQPVQPQMFAGVDNQQSNI
ncbi:MAG: DUF4176 domain-containing protein [Bacilli bacterium]|nr:DUF4176 domain-containing protein [Bacilli bacterium]